MRTSNPNPKNYLTDLLILGSFISLFYFFYLGSYPLFTPDEGRYSEVAREMLVQHDYITPRLNGVPFLDKPILYYWLQAIAIKLFGLKEWALRFFPILCGIMGTLITYLAGRQLFNRATGLLGALILASSPLYFGGAHYANLDLEVAVFISCSLLFFLMAVQTQEKPHKGYLLASYLSASLAILTKGMIGLAFPLLIVGLWILILKRWPLLLKVHFIKGLMLIFLIASPWYLLVQKANPNFFNYFFLNQQITRFVATAGFNNRTPFWFYLPVIALGFAPWSIFLLQSIYKAFQQIKARVMHHASLLFLVIWMLVVLVFFSIPHFKTVGYIMPIMPPIALLVAYYFVQQGKYLSTQDARHTRILLSIVMALLFVGLTLVLPKFLYLSGPIKLFIKQILWVLIGYSILSSFTLKRKNNYAFIAVCLLCNVILLMLLVTNAKYINQGSAKPLVKELKSYLQPQDEVITFFKYYQDLPLYLQRKVVVVADWNNPAIAQNDNWLRELWLNRNEKVHTWLIDENAFWQKWFSDKKVYVFLNETMFNYFKEKSKAYVLLGKQRDIFMLTNH